MRVDRKVKDNSELYSYLKECLEGQALDLVKAVYGGDTASKRYEAAWNVLEEHYGDPRVFADALLCKISDWQDINSKDGQGIEHFVALLERCLVEKSSSRHMDVLDTLPYMVSIMNKLLNNLKEKWSEQVVLLKNKEKRLPCFKDIVKFVKHQSDIINEPLFGREVFKSTSEVSSEPHLEKLGKSQSSTIFPTDDIQTISGTSQRAEMTQMCAFCSAGHFIDVCAGFLTKSLAERKAFLIMHRLCFACLRSGHIASQCSDLLICRMCSKGHATSLHYSTHRSRTTPKQAAPAVESTVESVCLDTAVPTCEGETQTGSNALVCHAVVQVWVEQPGGRLAG